MFQKLANFIRDEAGAVSVDFIVVWGGSMWMALGLVGDIGTATLSVTDKINDRLEYTSVVAEIVGDYGPGSGGGTDSASGGTVDCVGNPGNDKCVGNAGENPNGKGGWGSGSNGRSR